MPGYSSGRLSERCILLVDDNESVLQAVSFRLGVRGYTVVTARDVETALARIADTIFHAAILDVSLTDGKFRADVGGLAVARALPQGIPFIVFTAYEENDNVRRGCNEAGARAIIYKRSTVAPAMLVEAVERMFAQDVRVNFDLVIEGAVDVPLDVAQLAARIGASSAVAPPPSGEDLQHILQSLYFEADRVQLAPLFDPPQAAALSHSGAVLLQAQELRQGRRTAPTVVKLGLHQEIATEAERYELIRPYVGGHRLARLERTAFSRQVGGLVYALIGSQHGKPIGTLAALLRVINDTQAAIQLLETFFARTFADLHSALRWEPLALNQQYIEALHLTPARLVAAAGELQPAALDSPKISFDEFLEEGSHYRRSYLNPLHWAMPHGAFRLDAAQVRPQTICHGDLHARNILVDDERQCWLVDCARVAQGHALRDFAELESDLTFQVMPAGALDLLADMEQTLVQPMTWQDAPPALPLHHPLAHWQQIIAALRRIAAKQLALDGSMHDYYLALFWHTLNIIRLRQVDAVRKRHALLAAALLAERLEEWPAVFPIESNVVA
jgi:CheY-like chemotaxis protein